MQELQRFILRGSGKKLESTIGPVPKAEHQTGCMYTRCNCVCPLWTAPRLIA